MLPSNRQNQDRTFARLDHKAALIEHGVRISSYDRGVRISTRHGVRISGRSGVRISGRHVGDRHDGRVDARSGVRISGHRGVRISGRSGVRISGRRRRAAV